MEEAEPSQPSDRLYDVIVLGAGVVGVASAYALARRGLAVCLVDRSARPGQGASYANGGQLSYAYSDALGSPALVRKLPALMLGADPLFKLRPALDPDMAAWGLRFLRACSGEAYRRGTLATLALALESQRGLHELLARHPLEFGHATPGKMHLYSDADAFAAARAMAAVKQAHGVEQRVLSPAEATAIEPGLTGAKGLVGVIHSPADAVGDARRFCVALTEVLRRDYGVAARFGAAVASIALTGEHAALHTEAGETIRARTVLVALGPDSRPLLRPLGLRPPLLPMKGYSFNAAPGPAAPRISLTDTQRKIVFCQLDGVMRIAGGAELGARDVRVEPSRLAALVAEARAALPEAAEYAEARDGWAGLRPMTPSSTPIIARVRTRLVLNIGHGMLGWTLAMGSAERAAKLIVETAA